MEKKLTVNDIHFEKGEASYSNPRFVNQLHLGEVVPGVIPQVVVPDTKIDKAWGEQFEAGYDVYPVEKVHGFQWADLLRKKEIYKDGRVLHFSGQDHIEVAIKTLQQMRELVENYGILLIDRNILNILIKLVPHESKPSSWSYQVMQVDLGAVKDLVNKTPYIDKSINLKERKGTINTQELLSNNSEFAHNICVVVETLHTLATTDPYQNDISTDVKKELRNFYEQWDVMGFSRKGNDYISFNELEKFLKKLLTLQIKFEESPYTNLLSSMKKMWQGLRARMLPH
ncbi:MAG TPA: hypothetical protein VD999_04690 [Vitreimonas sp.]|nr:hypothetical protein [Vitreimonas sp.]